MSTGNRGPCAQLAEAMDCGVDGQEVEAREVDGVLRDATVTMCDASGLERLVTIPGCCTRTVIAELRITTRSFRVPMFLP